MNAPLKQRETMINKIALLMIGPWAACGAWAHDGHAAPGSLHWHATDVFGFIALALVLGVVAWWTGRKS